ncbi:tripeptidyl-peptidase I [Entomortierella parvispora]|uniref:Tripeptidyl-peptidase I n=1 Tax=Entomortierella parvispora TaxID=205924 RepID=A0A9P3LV89_9FUNG|nr:tripeptidyl-peptidase I [Entomortierella parvispora]
MPSPALIYFLLAIGLHCVLAFPATSPSSHAEFTQATSRLLKRRPPQSCNNHVTPACIQALYGIPKTRATQASNTIAVAGFLNEFANRADLASFLRTLRPDLNPAPTFSEVSIDGGRNDQNDPGELANLNVQYTIGLASGVPTTFYSVGRNDTTGYLDLVNTLIQQASAPSVLILTYGVDEMYVPPLAATNLCNAFKKLGERGTSIIVSSGDGGVAGLSTSNNCSTFIPSFPATCPYVTSVGATTGIQEVGADISAGGFSNIFPQPQYQKAAVSRYIKALGGQYHGRYDATGRGYPDVAAQGEKIAVSYKGEFTLIDGTEASALIFGSVIALLNDELISAGKPRLGFLNPLLYSPAGASGLTDITSGNNPGCNTNGFSAIKGWDPVTGLGTPKYAALRAAIRL